MIYPTQRTVLLAAAAAPVALLVAVTAPSYWLSGLGLLVLIAALTAVDALAGPSAGEIDLNWEVPKAVAVGERFELLVTAAARRVPVGIEAAAEWSGPVEPAASARTRLDPGPEGNWAGGSLTVEARRRGTGRLHSVWLRFPGLLGLVWKQRQLNAVAEIAITPDIRPLRQRGLTSVSRELMHGILPRPELGEGTEFDALADYRQGMDKRAIDWKQSARHTRLIAKEYRVERNNNVVVAIDSGRTMCEPVGAIPRLDRAISAALLTAFVALKQGDRVGLFAFDARPRASNSPVSGPAAFGLLQRVAAGIDYSSDETNFTLGLATLAAGLKRRSLIVVFTEFTDTVSAELMLGSLRPLLGRHLLLFVVLHDAELEDFVAAEPEDADAIVRAVTAAALLRERRLVLTRLKRLGVEVVEAPAAEAGPALVDAYLDLKQRGRL